MGVAVRLLGNERADSDDVVAQLLVLQLEAVDDALPRQVVQRGHVVVLRHLRVQTSNGR